MVYAGGESRVTVVGNEIFSQQRTIRLGKRGRHIQPELQEVRKRKEVTKFTGEQKRKVVIWDAFSRSTGSEKSGELHELRFGGNWTSGSNRARRRITIIRDSKKCSYVPCKHGEK